MARRPKYSLSDSELWNVYLPPFKAAVEAGAGNIMTAYTDLNGIPATGNHWLLTEVLRGTWGFGGFIVSDAQAVHNLRTHGFAAGLTNAGARGERRCRHRDGDRRSRVGAPAGSHRGRLIRGDSVRHGRSRNPVQVAAPAHRADDGGADPAGQPGGQRPDPAQHSVHQDGPAGNRAIAEDGPVPGDPQDAQAGAEIVADPSGRSTACRSGTMVSCAAVPEGQ